MLLRLRGTENTLGAPGTWLGGSSLKGRTKRARNLEAVAMSTIPTGCFELRSNIIKGSKKKNRNCCSICLQILAFIKFHPTQSIY
jgi:hypothetical protein